MPKISANKICLIRMSALGDTVHALALINALKRGYPNAEFTWILQPVPYQMVKYQPNIDRFILFEKTNGMKGWRKLIRDLRKEKFDLTIIPQVSFRSSLVTMLVKSRVKLGFDFKRSREMHWFFINKSIPPRTIHHAQDQMFEFLEYLEIPNENPEWDFFFTDKEKQWRQSFFNRFERSVISFVISTANPIKNWSIEGYASVMKYVDAELDLQPVIVGGPSQREQSMAAAIQTRSGGACVIALEPSIRKTMLQLSGSKIVVAPDTGPMHCAVALNVPTITLYGCSDPRRCGPYKKYQELLINKYYAPGEKKGRITRTIRKGNMDHISPDDVIQKIELAIELYSIQ